MRVYLHRDTDHELATDMDAESLYILAKLVERGLSEVKVRVYYKALPTSWYMVPIRMICLDRTLKEYLCEIIEAETRDTNPFDLGK